MMHVGGVLLLIFFPHIGDNKLADPIEVLLSMLE